jgi:hypothetical protein
MLGDNHVTDTMRGTLFPGHTKFDSSSAVEQVKQLGTHSRLCLQYAAAHSKLQYDSGTRALSNVVSRPHPGRLCHL